MPSYSSDSSVQSTISRNIHLIQFCGPRGGCDQHWALYVPDQDGSANGKIVHIRVNKADRHRVESCQMHFERFTPTRTRTPFRAFPIPGATVMATRIKKAGDEIYNAFFSGSMSRPDSQQYNMIINNCQHFCYLVLRNLNWNRPMEISKEAINYVESESTPLLGIGNLVQAFRGRQNPYPNPILDKNGVWWRFNMNGQVREYWDENTGIWLDPTPRPRVRMSFE